MALRSSKIPNAGGRVRLSRAMSMKDTLLLALARADQDDWNGAHELVQDIEHPLAAWVHANLHREEGDLGNARYWYGRAGRPFSSGDVRSERLAIAAEVGARHQRPSVKLGGSLAGKESRLASSTRSHMSSHSSACASWASLKKRRSLASSPNSPFEPP